MQVKSKELLQWLMVIIVLLGTIFMAIKKDQPEVLFSLCTLCFGYYFAKDQSDPPTSAA